MVKEELALAVEKINGDDKKRGKWNGDGNMKLESCRGTGTYRKRCSCFSFRVRRENLIEIIIGFSLTKTDLVRQPKKTGPTLFFTILL